MGHITISGIRCCAGKVFPYGSSVVPGGGINFSVNSQEAEGCSLQLYHCGSAEPYADIEIPDSFRTGSNYAITVFDQNPEELEYTFRFRGPMKKEEGLLFDSSKNLLDPYSKLLSGREVWGEARGKNTPFRSRVLVQDYDWEGDRPLEKSIKDLVIYEMHVRGISMDPASPVSRKGTFAGIVELIPYFKDLGVNCIELLPVFEFNELEYVGNIKDRPMFNYWGYSTISFFAPKAAYAHDRGYAGAVREMKDMVKELHRNGIEVILDVVYNHTAEMGDGGPVFNYRGIDNRIYYMQGENGSYPNYSGCGNTFNCNHPVVREHILDSLRYWVSEFHVDGFRFDEATVLTRAQNGEPMENPPLIEAITDDPVLSRTQVITETWDAAGLVLVGCFPGGKRWSEWNEVYRNNIRSFLRGDKGSAERAIVSIQGSPDLYKGEDAHATVNFVTCHDGFTLNDLVSYNTKHNEENGEDNRDGTNNNISWNCGVEGETDDEAIEELRNRQVKNAIALLMLSRGVPMMTAGDEFRNSQKGNNNAYCHDDELSWLNWKNREKHPDVYEFFKSLIHLRLENPSLRDSSSELTFNLTDDELCFSFMYDKSVFCAVNMSGEEKNMDAPKNSWTVRADSSGALKPGNVPPLTLTLAPHSVVVLEGRA
ncbi:MAG: DUF3459 domain-containing protein [Sphaerochaetaceae bacterium]|nr:DUF3459 domain-containing protein [Sphaerochaetaceae bacterium]